MARGLLIMFSLKCFYIVGLLSFVAVVIDARDASGQSSGNSLEVLFSEEEQVQTHPVVSRQLVNQAVSHLSTVQNSGNEQQVQEAYTQLRLLVVTLRLLSEPEQADDLDALILAFQQSDQQQLEQAQEQEAPSFLGYLAQLFGF